MYLGAGSTLCSSHPPCLNQPRLVCEATSSVPTRNEAAHKTNVAQDTAAKQPTISSSLSLDINFPTSFATHSFLYPSPVTDAHVMYTCPQPHPPPHTPHITSAIPSHQPIATQHQPYLRQEPTSSQTNATRLQQPQRATCPLPSELLTYVDYVKGYYNHDRFPAYFKESVVEVRAKDFIKIEMNHMDKFLDKLHKKEAQRFRLMGRIKDLSETSKSLNLDEFSSLLGNKFFTSVLVEGVPGVGKTTFAWELCWQWKEGKLLEQFDLVLLAQIRTDEMRKAVTLHDIIFHPDKTVSEAVVKHLQSNNGRGVLIIFEGYDEASLEQQSKE